MRLQRRRRKRRHLRAAAIDVKQQGTPVGAAVDAATSPEEARTRAARIRAAHLVYRRNLKDQTMGQSLATTKLLVAGAAAADVDVDVARMSVDVGIMSVAAASVKVDPRRPKTTSLRSRLPREFIGFPGVACLR